MEAVRPTSTTAQAQSCQGCVLRRESIAGWWPALEPLDCSWAFGEQQGGRLF